MSTTIPISKAVKETIFEFDLNVEGMNTGDKKVIFVLDSMDDLGYMISIPCKNIKKDEWSLTVPNITSILKGKSYPFYIVVKFDGYSVECLNGNVDIVNKIETPIVTAKVVDKEEKKEEIKPVSDKVKQKPADKVKEEKKEKKEDKIVAKEVKKEEVKEDNVAIKHIPQEIKDIDIEDIIKKKKAADALRTALAGFESDKLEKKRLQEVELAESAVVNTPAVENLTSKIDFDQIKRNVFNSKTEKEMKVQAILNGIKSNKPNSKLIE